MVTVQKVYVFQENTKIISKYILFNILLKSGESYGLKELFIN